MEHALNQGSFLPRALLTGCVALGKSLCLSESPFSLQLHTKGESRGLR